jgi:hypothetical protein
VLTLGLLTFILHGYLRQSAFRQHTVHVQASGADARAARLWILLQGEAHLRASLDDRFSLKEAGTMLQLSYFRREAIAAEKVADVLRIGFLEWRPNSEILLRGIDGISFPISRKELLPRLWILALLAFILTYFTRFKDDDEEETEVPSGKVAEPPPERSFPVQCGDRPMAVKILLGVCARAYLVGIAMILVSMHFCIPYANHPSFWLIPLILILGFVLLAMLWPMKQILRRQGNDNWLTAVAAFTRARVASQQSLALGADYLSIEKTCSQLSRVQGVEAVNDDQLRLFWDSGRTECSFESPEDRDACMAALKFRQIPMLDA